MDFMDKTINGHLYLLNEDKFGSDAFGRNKAKIKNTLHFLFDIVYYW